MNEYEAKQIIRSLAEEEYDTRIRDVGQGDRPIWNPEVCQQDAASEGRQDEADMIGGAIRVLAGGANRAYTDRWYECLAGHR